MGMLKALALLGAGASGYASGVDEFRREKRMQDADARMKVLQARQDQEYEQQQADDQAMRNAAAPVTIVSDPVPQPIGSFDAPRPQSDQGITVNGQSYPDMASANAAAATANALPARLSRAASAVQNPMLAAKLGADAQTAQLAGMQVAQANRAEANRVFDDGLKDALRKGPDALAKFMSDSAADGQGGAVKFQAQTNPDGSWQMMKLTPDGKQVPFGQKFSGDENGMATAGFMLSRAVPDESKLSHALAVKKAESEDEGRKSLAKYHDRMANYYDKLIDVKHDANAVREAAANGKLANMPEEDKAALADLNKQLELINGERVKAQAAGMWQPDSPGAAAIAKQEASLLMQRRALLAPYLAARGAEAPDPLGLRGVGSGTTAKTTRPPTKMEAIAADMQKTGTTDAKIQVSNPDAPYTPDASTPTTVAAAPAAAASAAPAKRVKPEAVVNFAGKPKAGSAEERRATAIASTKAKIPQLQKAVDDAWNAVKEAKAKGPMFEARARDAWVGAKSALQDAKERVGS